MKVKLLKKVRKRYSICKYTYIDKRSRIYDLTRQEPTEEKPVYIALDNYDYFIPVIYESESKKETQEQLIKRIIFDYGYKFPRNKSKSIKL